MSQYISTENNELDQIASNQGWSDFCDWVKTLPMDDYPSLCHLVEFGRDNDPELARDDIEDAIENYKPSDDVAETANGLVDFLATHLKAEIILVSNGMMAGEAEVNDMRAAG